jgi:hypothetical protein
VDERPVTRYATSVDGVSVAFQVCGDGPLDLLFPTELGLPVDLLWEDPGFVRGLMRHGRTRAAKVRCDLRHDRWIRGANPCDPARRAMPVRANR